MVVQHRQDLREEDRTLTFEAAEQASRLEDSLHRARSLTQILAQNPAPALLRGARSANGQGQGRDPARAGIE